MTDTHSTTTRPTKTEFDDHTGNTSNPHSVTAAQAGADPSGSAAAVQSNLDDHEAAAAPHSGHEETANKDAVNGYAGLNGDGHIVGPIIPRYDTGSNLDAIVLGPGEVAVESDTGAIRTGDNTTAGGLARLPPVPLAQPGDSNMIMVRESGTTSVNVADSGTRGGTFVFGAVNGLSGYPGTIDIQSPNRFGSVFVGGFASSGGTLRVNAGYQDGAVLLGAAPIRGTIEVGGFGSFAQGCAGDYSKISAIAQGSFARGCAADYSGDITASGLGSFATGNTSGSDITASGAGSFAIGNSQGGSIIASGDHAMQLGPGTNAIDQSFKSGNIHLIGSGEPDAGDLEDGQFWYDDTANEFRARVNGSTVSFDTTAV